MTQVPVQRVPLNKLLNGLCAEVQQLAQLAHPIEQVVVSSLANRNGAHSRAEDLQNVDLLLQSIDAVSDILATLAESVPNDCRVNPNPALEVIKLDAVRKRILAEIQGDPDPDMTPEMSDQAGKEGEHKRVDWL